MSRSDTRPDPGECAPAPALAGLNAFVGAWRTTGRIRATAGAAETWLDALDTYEWMPGGRFLVHHVRARMGEDEVHALEITGYDTRTGRFVLRSFDNHGGFATSYGELRGRHWTIVGDSERFAGRFSEDGERLTGSWEATQDGRTWRPWMDITLTKQH